MYYNSTYFKDNDGLVFKVYTHLCFSFLLKKRVIPLSWHVRGAQWLASRELSVVKGVEGNAKPDCGFHVGVQSLPTLSASRPSLGRKPHQKAALQRWGACAMWGYWGSQRWGPHGKRQASRQPHAGAQKQIFHSWALKWLQSGPTAWRWHQERGCQAPHCPAQTDWGASLSTNSRKKFFCWFERRARLSLLGNDPMNSKPVSISSCLDRTLFFFFQKIIKLWQLLVPVTLSH